MSVTILVMDDDTYMRELLGLHLCDAGYEVLLAEDAIVAGHLLLERRIDLFVADIDVPYMNGLELVRAMRNDPSLSSMPVILVTSHEEHAGCAKELGAVGFLRKPVRADDLLATVAKHVSSHRSSLSFGPGAAGAFISIK